MGQKTPGIPAEQFTVFQKTILSADDSLGASLTAHGQARNLHMVRYAALIVLLTNVFWLAVDLSRSGEMNLHSGPALLAVSAQILSSAYVLLLSWFACDKEGKLVRYSLLLYYVCLVLGVTVLAVTKNIQMLKAGTNYALAGIPLSTCFLFILILAPLPSKRDSIFLAAVFIVTMFVPAFLPGKELYSLAQQVIIRLCMIVAYWYFRGVNLALDHTVEQLAVLSYTDPLTGVLNRRALDAYWRSVSADKDASCVGVLLFDIDDFKKYNDRYTHIKGDEALIAVCRAVISALDADARFVFRYGGEEFVVALPCRTDEEVVNCGLRVNRAVYDAFFPRQDVSERDRITITVGCAREEIDRLAKPDYITRADIQLYIGKNGGKNCVVFGDKIYR